MLLPLFCIFASAIMEQCPQYTIYFGDARVDITSSQPLDGSSLLVVDDSLSVLRAKIVKKVETNKFVTILSPNPSLTFKIVASQFVEVRAAGGVVTNGDGELLMIYLRRRWDLPKGHIEPGESSAEAACREVLEETGIVASIVGEKPLITTMHAYDTYGRWELKYTDWWRMEAVGGELRPQTEEGILGIGWYAGVELAESLKSTYPTIKAVVDALKR